MMNETVLLALATGAGLLLGGFFFGGLWWTVRRGMSSKRPALLFLVSLLLRTGVLLAGFYFVSGARWDRLLACFVGFMIARFLVTRLIRLPVVDLEAATNEAGHAP